MEDDEDEEDLFSGVRSAASELQQKNGFAVLMLFNADFLRLVRNWVCHVQKLSGNILDKIVFVATEASARDSLLAFDPELHVALAEPGNVQGSMLPGQRKYSEHMLFRTQLQLDLLQHGLTILNVEADATWIHNPIPAVVAKLGNIVAYRDALAPAKVPSFGFMLLRPTPATITLWKDLEARQGLLLEHIFKTSEEEREDAGGDQQPLLLHALLKKHSGVKVGWLGKEVVVSGSWYNDRSVRSFTTSVVHNNYISGSVAKEKRAAEWGHWFLDIAGSRCAHNGGVPGSVLLESPGSSLGLVPWPEQVTFSYGAPLVLGGSDSANGVRLDVSSPELYDVVREYVLEPNGFHTDPEASRSLRLLMVPNMQNERYRLSVAQSGVEIAANTAHGLFNGVMTLRQLLYRRASSIEDGSPVTVPALMINDAPAFAWRGMMLDVSRHFFGVQQIRRLLDTMAFFKLNRFHWHLTDDQGWRFPVEKYPRLIDVGSKRKSTQIGHEPRNQDGEPYSGSYSTNDIHEILSHAARLHIEVVPEIDAPGHTQAVIAAYPELGNEGIDELETPVEVATVFGPQEHTLSPTNKSFQFMEAVIAEVAKTMPSSRYVHIGGDEVSQAEWKESSIVRSLMNTSAVESLDTIPSLFVKAETEQLTRLHRTTVAWDEALYAGGLPPDAVIMAWRPDQAPKIARHAVSKGHQVVIADHDYTYFDLFQAENEPYDAIGGLLPLERVYDLPLKDYGEPAPGRDTHGSDSGGGIIGGQGLLWSEYFHDWRQVEYMAWPRGCALSEVVWSGTARPGFSHFFGRLKRQLDQLGDLGIHFRNPGGPLV
eukprot:TRINITY_DN13605_c1_g1_i1.p1 TRINITY_DN13605_c1_g1~~TRINITY_DN13605_c1_g1_i1.p1  ORF type:complete len:908 (-),score=141.90 TRINITY_DN13605_c1_g1_i1:225-2690(-)